MTAPSLTARLIAGIEAGGPMRFDHYMARALFDPEHGYYASGRAGIGRHGDFYTNVSVGRMFGRVIAAQCAEIWERLGRPAAFGFVEQGANDGRLAADVLDALREDHPDCFRSTRCTLVEPFPKLASAQRAALAEHAGRVNWVKSLDALPAFIGVHFTNEYADALPVRLFARLGAEWWERHVAVRDGSLHFENLRCANLPPELPRDAPEPYLAETRPDAARWVGAVAAKLERGAMLVVDYGFPRDPLYAPWRTAGTLSCYRAHRRDDDPLDAPGEKDLTAHVDFTGLAGAGLAAGLDLAGFADQYHFLVGAATPLLLAMETAPASPPRDADLRALKTLIHPETMGTQFKYLALTRHLDGSTPLAGFRHARPARKTLGI
ncbi:MAG: SAM-dependent methyltransferase [Terrimicrobiaceae bacterium]|nr:SAM-dependent methyltransferase [Terrimicrobiaceae bacterium]